MNEKEMLVAVKKAANVPADGWGVTWNPLYHPSHCAELIASHRVNVLWDASGDMVHANIGDDHGYSEPYSFNVSTEQQAMRRAVCRAVIGGAA